jgi:hypothetical protein
MNEDEIKSALIGFQTQILVLHFAVQAMFSLTDEQSRVALRDILRQRISEALAQEDVTPELVLCREHLTLAGNSLLETLERNQRQ